MVPVLLYRGCVDAGVMTPAGGVGGSWAEAARVFAVDGEDDVAVLDASFATG
jgi:hypothetical protein